MMINLLFVKLRRRSAVSTMIGGIIILSLLLTALGTMVFVSQQYDSYQSTVNQMSQIDINRFSENLGGNGGNTGAIYPGLNLLSTTATGCGGTCQQYNMTLSNLAGIGTQIARVYVNSTSGICLSSTGGCVLDPASSAGGCAKTCLRKADRFVNPGEYSHGVVLWLSQQLPSSTYGANSVSIVTTRGRVFSFQWPFPPVGQAIASGTSISTGVMKVAYTGTVDNSKNEPGWVAAGSGGTAGPGNCHTESPPASDKIAAGTYGTLYFVNPWVTDTILGDAAFGSPPVTTLFIYASLMNTKASTITITTGSLLIQVTQATANAKVFYIGGTYVGGLVGSGGFVAAPSPLSITPGQVATLIFEIFNYNIGNNPGKSAAATLSFAGTAAISNTATDSSYYGASILLDGFYDRTSCLTP